MSGHRKFSQLIENFSEERQAEIDKKTAQLKSEMALNELRQALEISQTKLAHQLNIKEPDFTNLEKQTDTYVSHLRKVIEMMGGQLDIIARFPEVEVKINNFSELNKEKIS